MIEARTTKSGSPPTLVKIVIPHSQTCFSFRRGSTLPYQALPKTFPDRLRTMDDNNLKQRRNVTAPFIIFFIIVGCGGILIRILPLFGPFRHDTYVTIRKILWTVSAIGGLTYSAIRLRQMLKGTVVDRLMYVFFILVFATLGVLAFYIF
ncbi:MAG TPA: hypothetical protein VFC07_08120 [Verrucomicrobiae bacterium]|nr:hypothetical protein [Verrucomicrobiae bacterium]